MKLYNQVSFFALSFVSIILYAAESPALTLFSPEKQAKGLLVQLLVSRKVLSKNDNNCDAHKAHKLMQDNFFQKKEYFEIANDETNLLKISPYIGELGLLKRRDPEKKSYEGLIFLDGSLLWMCERLAYLMELGSRDISFNHLYICAGRHQFDAGRSYTQEEFERIVHKKLPTTITYDVLLEKTEEDVLRKMFAAISLPEKLKSTKTEWVISDINKETGARPNTQSNAIDFLKANPVSGEYLLISNAPHIPYQWAVFFNVLRDKKSSITIEGVGPEDPQEFTVAQHLDRLARLGYEEYKILQYN